MVTNRDRFTYASDIDDSGTLGDATVSGSYRGVGPVGERGVYKAPAKAAADTRRSRPVRIGQRYRAATWNPYTSRDSCACNYLRLK